MNTEAMLPCLVCGKTLETVWQHDSESAPYGGTEFRTYGHYGSTFWDSFYGEELILTVCDDCLRERSDRLAQQKRYLPILVDGVSGYGRQWVERPMVSYTGSEDHTVAAVEPEELGTDIHDVEWPHDIEERKRWLED
jgi:hypothetical protein